MGVSMMNVVAVPKFVINSFEHGTDMIDKSEKFQVSLINEPTLLPDRSKLLSPIQFQYSFGYGTMTSISMWVWIWDVSYKTFYLF